MQNYRPPEKHDMAFLLETGYFWAPTIGAAVIGTWLAYRILLAFYEGIVSPIIFPPFMQRFAETYNEKLDKVKRELFWDLTNVERRFEDRPVILEIGAGTGANFSYYPDGASVIPVEPNAGFESYIDYNAKKFPRLTVEKMVQARGEDMRDIPDESVHAVVTTLTLCTVSDPKAVVSEIKRILKPNGRFYFLEPIAGKCDTWTRTFQNIVSPWWPSLAGGCQARDVWREVNQGGFYSVEYHKFTAPLSPLYSLLRPHLVGFAVKK